MTLDDMNPWTETQAAIRDREPNSDVRVTVRTVDGQKIEQAAVLRISKGWVKLNPPGHAFRPFWLNMDTITTWKIEPPDA